MLPRVLLHVIEASRPINATIHPRTRGHFHVHDVPNIVSVIAHVQYVRLTQPTQVVRLSS